MIGEYRTRFVRMVATFTREATYGEAEATYADGTPELWGKFAETSADTREAYSQSQGRAAATIKLRGPVTLSFNDRLRDKSTGYVYHVEGVYVDRLDTSAICYRVTA